MKSSLRLRQDPRSSPALLALFASAFTACSGGETTPTTTPRPVATLTAGAFSVRIDPDKGALALRKGETILLDFPLDGLELGTVTALDDATNYDPTTLAIPNALQPPPDGLAFAAATSIDVTASTDKSLTIRLRYPGGNEATLTVDAQADGRFRLKLAPTAAGAPVGYFRLRPRADAKEGFYGLGESFDDVNQRGKIRPMQLETDGEIESHYNEVHVPIPFLIGTQGWGLFVDSAYPAVFSVATEAADVVEATFGTGLASTKGLTFYLFGSERALDVTRHYYDVTGYPSLPARWALGPWVWRDENKDQAQVLGDVQAMRDLDLAATGYWIDRPYATAVNTFDFVPAQFPDPKAMIGALHGLGFRTALWHTPYLDEAAASTAALRAEATTKGYYPPAIGVLLNKWGKPIDVTNPAAQAWWQQNLGAYTAIGVEGYKLDYGEDVVPGLTSARNPWKFSDGSDERTMHARFQIGYHATYAKTLPAGGGFLLCRHATVGDQKSGAILWPGDLDASFAKHREVVKDPGGDYTAVGGLPASIVAGISLGPSGFPFFGADTGGYRHSPPDKELFTRWFEQTALSSVMQIGNSASTVAWEPDAKTGFDAEMLGWYRTYTRLHLRLFPYAWTYATNLQKDGRPLQRPVGLAYPDLGVHPSDEYLFGDSILVAPVVARGAVSRTVIFPPGTWIDWWTGKSYEGGSGEAVMVPAPLGVLPLFVAEGGIIPMLRPTIDTLTPVTDAAKVDSYATTPGLLWARVAPGAASQFAIFDGATITQEKKGSVIALGSLDGAELKNGVVFEVIALGAKPTSVTDGGKALSAVADAAALDLAASGWVYLPDAGGTALVKVTAGAHTVAVTLP
ncbi:MAG: TIM-barrel domain-containing protein [Byssovorax sp.]